MGISISTDQIQSYDEFINSYNANRMAAPIDTKFLFREKEFQDIINAYLKVDVVILSGSSGTGKTRLALHYVKIMQMLRMKGLTVFIVMHYQYTRT